MSFTERMLKIDRRIIFLVIGLCTLLPLLYPVGLPIKISQEVRGVYDHIESLPEGSVFLLSLDFDPASKPELHPQSISLLRHAFRKNLRVIAMTLWVSGTGMADQLSRRSPRDGQGKREGLCVPRLESRRDRRHHQHGAGSLRRFPVTTAVKRRRAYPCCKASRV